MKIDAKHFDGYNIILKISSSSKIYFVLFLSVQWIRKITPVNTQSILLKQNKRVSRYGVNKRYKR